MSDSYMVYYINNQEKEIFIPEELEGYLKENLKDTEVFKEFLSVRKGFKIIKIPFSEFGTWYGWRTMKIKRPKRQQEKKSEKGAFAYILITFGNGKPWFKVGYTNNLTQRIQQLNTRYNTYYKEVWSKEFSTIEGAAAMEIDLHYFYKKLYPKNFVPNDHFQGVTPNLQENFSFIEQMATECEKRYPSY